MRKILILFLLASNLLLAQITWTNVTGNYSLPQGAELYEGIRTTPALKAWYIKVDLNNENIAVRPYISTAPGGKEGIVPSIQRVGAYAGINGGYFDINTGSSYSAVVYPGELKAQNVQVLSRNGVTYYATRSLFGIDENKNLSVNWIYHFNGSVDGIYTFDQPNPNQNGSPALAPQISNGNQFEKIFLGLGGGPTLVKNGQVNVTYNEEVFFGSGVGYDNRDPRSAVGFTNDNQVIMLVADGRQVASQGVGLPELAQIMIDLGCVEAMNLDGGGSSQMAVGSSLINLPAGGTFQREIPTFLAVVDADSIPFPQTIYFEEIIDTEDQGATQIGSGWFTSANPGYWGNSPAWLNEVGTGESKYIFTPNISKAGEYEVYAWWVASSNRRTDTPFIIDHSGGNDTVRVNQQGNNSTWVLLGTYDLPGDGSVTITVTDEAGSGTGTYVVADAVRIISYDSTTTSVESNIGDVPKDFSLLQNYPNPFNPKTIIPYFIPSEFEGFVSIKVYNLLGREVATLLDKPMPAGAYEIEFDAADLPSGVYFYKLTAGNFIESKKMILLK